MTKRLRPAKLSNPLASGFSLIELLITLACMGILVGWAWPHYQTYWQRSQRAQARVLLIQTALWMERSASANGQYPLPKDIPPSLLLAPELPYQLQVNSTPDTYTLYATPTGPQLEDACGTLVLNHLGVRSVQNKSESNITANSCWQR